MFRRERPQKGRYRQFHQFGAETFGFEGPDIDAELIALSARLWKKLGFADQVELQINSLGSNQARESYKRILVAYLSKHKSELDEDSLRRLDKNPLRILDSKNPAMASLIEQAPKLNEHLDQESAEHFAALCQMLDALGIAYTVNPTLVRGLDYYNRTVFEWVTNSLGAQGTICAGGRYDGLVEQLGGQSTTACGFAMGLERIILMLEQQTELKSKLSSTVDVYLCMLGESAQSEGLAFAETIRSKHPKIRLQMHCGGGNFKKQLKKADRSEATLALILGEDEVKEKSIGIKYLREDKPQETLPQAKFLEQLESILN